MLNYLSRTSQITTKTLSIISATSLALQTRNTYILKRRYPLLLHKRGEPPRKLRMKHNVYDLVENNDNKKREDIKVVLLDYVEGIGRKGEVVSVPRYFGRNQLLVNQLADYASPENLAKYQQLSQDEEKDEAQHSSVYSLMTEKYISRSVVSIIMNMDNPWTIEKWHIRASLRKAGIIVPDYAISMPDKQISGPNMDLQNKIFLITVTINNLEKAIVRCKIHHHTNDPKRKIPWLPYYWLAAAEPVFPEDLELLNSLPSPPVPKSMKKGKT